MQPDDGAASSNGAKINAKISEEEQKKRECKKKIIICVVAVLVAVALFLVGLFSIGLSLPLPELIKVVLFFGGAAGLVLSIVLAIRYTLTFFRLRKGVETNVPSILPKQVRSFINSKLPNDVIRIPLQYDDEAGHEILKGFTERFLKNVVFPRGFEDFLYDEERTVFIHYYQDGFDVDYIEMDGKYEADRIKDVNMDLIVYNDDYFTQFRRVVFFADDESGHRHFLLDYGYGGEPKVRILDDELDTVELLADNFAEFLQNMVTPREAHDLLGKEYYG